MTAKQLSMPFRRKQPVPTSRQRQMSELLRSYAEKGRTLDWVSDALCLKRPTLMAYCRRFKIKFPDHRRCYPTPPGMRKNHAAQ